MHAPHQLPRGRLTLVKCDGDGGGWGAVSQDGTARVWDMEIGDCVLVMEGHDGPVTNAALAGTVLLTSSQDGTIRVWDMEQGQCLRSLTGHTAAVNAVAVTRDGRRAVSVSSDETACIWDLKSGRAVHTLLGRSGAPCSSCPT